MKRKDIYTEAWNITWKYKFLWVFGFLAGITLNTKGGTTDYFSSGAWLFLNLDTVIGNNMGVTTILMAGLAILLWLVGLVARADLIHGAASIANITKTDQISFKAIFSLGFSSLPKLVGMQIIVWLPLIILTVTTAFQTSQLSIDEFSFFFLNFASISTIVVIIILLLGLSFLDAFAFRLIVLDSESIIGSIKRAWQIIRHNWGRILKTTIVCGILGIIFGVVVGIPLTPIMALLMSPMIVSTQEAMQECTANNIEFEIMSECFQEIMARPMTQIILLPSSLVIAGVYSVWTTFLSVVFTLLYGDIVAMSITTKQRKRGKQLNI